MTLSTITSTKEHVGNGVAVDFGYDFLIFESDHMKVYLNGILQASGYAVSGVGNPAGGTVTFSVAPANGVRVSLYRVVPMTQLTDYLPYDKFPSAAHEAALDKLTMIVQQVEEITQRAISAPIGSDPDVDYTLPQYDAGKGLMWNPLTKELTNSDDNINGIVSDAQAAASASAGSASASAGSASDAELARLAAEAAQLAAELARDDTYNFPNTANIWNAVQSYSPTVKSPVGAAVVIDFATEPCHQWTLDQNVTVTFSNADVFGRSVQIEMANASGGSYTISWPVSVIWTDDSFKNGPPAGERKITYLWSNGSDVYGAVTWGKL